MTEPLQGLVRAGNPVLMLKLQKDASTEYRFLFRCLSIVLRHGKEKLQDLLLGDAGEVTLTKSPSKSAVHEITCLDGIFFPSWLCGTADGNRPLGKHSCCTSCGWGSMSDMLTLGVYTMMQIGYRETLPAQE